jgi:hypothetical protein
MPASSLPLLAGLFMFALTASGFLWRKYGRSRAGQDLAALATELGLAFVASRYKGSAGKLSGQYQGYQVRFDPEESRSLSVRLARTIPLELRSYETRPAPPRDWETLYSADREFDRYFKTRFAARGLARALAAQPMPSRYLEPFRGPLAARIKSLVVSEDSVRCELELGHPPYISPAAIRELLPACVKLAGFVESLPIASADVAALPEAPAAS